MNKWKCALGYAVTSILLFSLNSGADAEFLMQLKDTIFPQANVQIPSSPKKIENQIDRARFHKEQILNSKSTALSKKVVLDVRKQESTSSYVKKRELAAPPSTPLTKQMPVNLPVTIHDVAPSTEQDFITTVETLLPGNQDHMDVVESIDSLPTMTVIENQDAMAKEESESSVDEWKERIVSKLGGFLDADDDSSDTPTTVLGIDGLKPRPEQADNPITKQDVGSDNPDDASNEVVETEPSSSSETPDGTPKDDGETEPSSSSQIPDGTPKDDGETEPSSSSQIPDGAPRNDGETEPSSSSETPDGTPKNDGETEPSSSTDTPDGTPKNDVETEPSSSTETPVCSPKDDGETEPTSSTETPVGSPKDDGETEPTSSTETPDGSPKNDEETEPTSSTEIPDGSRKE